MYVRVIADFMVIDLIEVDMYMTYSTSYMIDEELYMMYDVYIIYLIKFVLTALTSYNGHLYI